MSGFHHDPAVDDELRLADGRRVTYSRFGDPDGTPVLNCHGGLMCRFDVEPCAAEVGALGAFVVSPDRPGVGGSDRKRGRATVDWAEDARELLDALGIDQVAVMGWSMGGQYAAAVAARMPHRVSRLAIIAGAPPLDDPARFAELNQLDRRLARLSRRMPPVARVMFVASGWAGRRAPGRVSGAEARQLPDADAAVVRGLDGWLGEVTGEGGRQGGGMVDEYRAFVAPWGFAVDEVVAPTRIYQGTVDSLVPPSWARELAAMIPDATVTEFEGEGHMIAMSRRAEIVRALVT